MKETGVPGENHQSVASFLLTLSHNIVSSTKFKSDEQQFQQSQQNEQMTSHLLTHLTHTHKDHDIMTLVPAYSYKSTFILPQEKTSM